MASWKGDGPMPGMNAFRDSPFYGQGGYFRRPVKVHFLGWSSDTYRLQHNGWQVSAHQDFQHQALQIALHHPESGLYGLSEYVEIDFMSATQQMDYLDHITLNITAITTKMIVRHEVYSMPETMHRQFSPVDCTPGYVYFKNSNIEDLIPFRPLPKFDNELIVKPDSVPELLDKILVLQDGKMKDLIEKQRERESRGEVENILQGKKISNHCNIISIAS